MKISQVNAVMVRAVPAIEVLAVTVMCYTIFLSVAGHI